MVEYSDSEFCVVMTLNRKDGSSCDIRVYADDDPHELAKEYICEHSDSRHSISMPPALEQSGYGNFNRS